MPDSDPLAAIGERYRRFAALEAAGRSPRYEALAHGVADDRRILGLLAALPVQKRQPNLLFGVVQYLFGCPADVPAFTGLVASNWPEIAHEIELRSTQTNEVSRCTSLLLAIAHLPGPIALLEIGASAGLCLLLDRYRYDFGDGIVGEDVRAPLLRCSLSGVPRPVPTRIPEVVWRLGIDRNPLDVRSSEDRRWLEALVWPDEEGRRERLSQAVALALEDPPVVERRDLRRGVGDLVARAPAGATLVLFHHAALTYVGPGDRAAFEVEVLRSGAEWVANEGAVVLPSVRARLGSDEIARHRGDYVLSRNGDPIAWGDPHGNWVEWRSPSPLEM